MNEINSSFDAFIENKSPDIEKLLEKWGFPWGSSKRDKMRARIKLWLKNDEFQQKDENDVFIYEDAFLFLNLIRYLDGELSYFTEQLAKGLMAYIEANSIDKDKIILFPLGDSTSDGGNYYISDLKRNLGITKEITPLNSFSNYNFNFKEIQAVIFVDDFIGTGKTVNKFLKTNKNKIIKLKQKNVKIIILCVVGFKKRRKELEFMSETIDYVQFALDLFDEDKVFSDKSRYFKDPIVRTRIHNWCKDIGLELYPVGPLGYDNSQSLIVFKDGYVPNNTLPIIWAGPDSECETNLSKKWQPLFTRKRKSENKKLIFNTNLELHSQSNKKNIPIEDSEQKVELHWNELIKIKKQWEKIGIKKKGLWMNNPKEERSLQIFFNNKLKKEFKEDIFEIYNDEIKALIQQIEIHQKNLLHYQLQDAKMGMLAPPLIANGILDEKDALREKGIRLKKLIENIYGEQIEFNFSTH